MLNTPGDGQQSDEPKWSDREVVFIPLLWGRLPSEGICKMKKVCVVYMTHMCHINHDNTQSWRGNQNLLKGRAHPEDTSYQIWGVFPAVSCKLCVCLDEELDTFTLLLSNVEGSSWVMVTKTWFLIKGLRGFVFPWYQNQTNWPDQPFLRAGRVFTWQSRWEQNIKGKLDGQLWVQTS